MTMRFRIASIFIAAALVLSCGVLAAGHFSLYARRDAVSLEETTLLGDVSAAEGIQVDIRTELMNQLFWDTQYTAGTSPATHTDYTHYWSEQPNAREWDRDVLQVDHLGGYGVTNQEWETEDKYGMQKPYNDVASRCPAGTKEYTERVRLRDYYEYFPIYISTADILPEDVDSIYLNDAESVELMMQDFLRSQFRFPVPEDLWMEISIDKAPDGSVSGVGTSFFDDYSWEQLEISTIRADAGLYFTLSPGKRADGTAPDFSHCTVERGLYFLPITLAPYEGDDFADIQDLVTISLDTEHFRTVCPIDADADWVSLLESEDEKWLYLLSQQRGEATLAVLSADTGEVTSSVTLFTLKDPEEQYLSKYVQEGYLIATLSDGQFSLATVDAAGRAVVALTGDFGPALAWECYMDNAVFDYNGQRLAFADLTQQFNGCSFFLGVVSDRGMEYLGKYFHNQDAGGGQYNGCSPVEQDPLTVRLPDDT